MDKYIGFKLVEAEPQIQLVAAQANGNDFNKGKDGYKIVYQDGYESWTPKEVFESSYMKVIPNLRLKTNVSISQEMVDSFIKTKEVSTIGNKTTLVRVTLVNGFEIIETSACVDPDNYSEEIGGEVCLKKIKDKIWMLLGFLLQTAVEGIKAK